MKSQGKIKIKMLGEQIDQFIADKMHLKIFELLEEKEHLLGDEIDALKKILT